MGRIGFLPCNPFIHIALQNIERQGTRAQDHFVKFLDVEVWTKLLAGMGAQISHALAQAGIAHRMKSLGIAGEFGQSAYVAEHLYEKHGLTAAKMAQAALELMGKN